MNIDALTKSELLDLYSKVRSRLKIVRDKETLAGIKERGTLSKYSYILWELDEDGFGPYIGMSSLSEGYIDDHIPSEVEEDYYDLINILGFSEAMTCTYDYDQNDLPRIKEIFDRLGIKEAQPNWD